MIAKSSSKWTIFLLPFLLTFQEVKNETADAEAMRLIYLFLGPNMLITFLNIRWFVLDFFLFLEKPIRQVGQKDEPKYFIKYLKKLFWNVSLVYNCNGINCYTCSSVNGSNPHCEDPINTHLSVYTEKCMVPKKNHVGLFPANFCIKITGVNTDTYERMVIRACVMKTMDSQCGMFKYQDQAMNGCVLTCDYNGCNKSEKTESSIISYIFITFASIFLSTG